MLLLAVAPSYNEAEASQRAQTELPEREVVTALSHVDSREEGKVENHSVLNSPQKSYRQTQMVSPLKMFRGDTVLEKDKCSEWAWAKYKADILGVHYEGNEQVMWNMLRDIEVGQAIGSGLVSVKQVLGE